MGLKLALILLKEVISDPKALLLPNLIDLVPLVLATDV